MDTTKTTHIASTLAAALGFALVTACNPPPPPPVTPASAAEAKLTVFVDPDVEVGVVQDEKGRELLPEWCEALAAALNDAGYHVVASSTAPHDLTFHTKVARVGFNYVRWADGVVVEVKAPDQTVTQATRKALNFVHIEGKDTAARLTFAARSLVNALGPDARLEDFAKTRPSTGGAPAGASDTTASPPPATAAPHS
jgi:hypothetical protein